MVNQTFGPYRLLEKLGDGGMGVVYRAEDRRLHRTVALKFLPPELSTDPSAIERLLREAQAASALNHPHICTVFDIGEGGGGHFIVMELLEGQTLKERAGERAVPVGDVVRWATQLADALEAAHGRGIIHRDLKPANIFITRRGDAKILDFGIATFVDVAVAADARTETSALLDRLTAPGRAVGTAPYMSPEQVRGDSLDRRTDLFSLGTVLYELVTGRLPFEGGSAAAIYAAILHDAPAQADRLAPRLPPQLGSIIAKLLEKDPALRYQHASDVRSDIERLKRDTGEGAGAAAAPAPARHARRRWAIGAGVGVAAIVAVAALAVWKPAPSAPLTDRDLLLLADVTNTTGEPVFDETLKRALALQLEQSPFLSLLADAQVRETLRFMGRSADDRVEGAVARDLCQRRGATAMLAASIQSLGSGYILDMNATNCATGDPLAGEQIQAKTREDVLPALGRAAARLREKLGESLASVQQFDAPTEDVTTASLEAFKAFALGERERARSTQGEGVAFYLRAIDLDPDFALAYQRVATIYRNNSQRAKAATYARQAFERRQRVSTRERLYIETRYYTSVTGEIEKAIETLTVLAQMYPRDWSAANQLAFNTGIAGRHDRALALGLEAVRRAPDHPIPNDNLPDYYMRVDRFAEAEKQIEMLVSRWNRSRWKLYPVGFVLGNDSAMRQARVSPPGPASTTPGGDVPLVTVEARAAAFGLKWRTARTLYEQAAELSRGREGPAPAGIVLTEYALVAALLGHARESASAARAVAMTSDDQYALGFAAIALALAGGTSEAQRAIDQLAKMYPVDTLIQSVIAPGVAGAIALQSHAPAGVDGLAAPNQYEMSNIPSMLPCVPVYIRAQTLLARGADARQEFRKIVDRRGLNAASPVWPLAYLGLARAHAAAGDSAAARAAYDEVFKAWHAADADALPLIEAKREYARLSAPR